MRCDWCGAWTIRLDGFCCDAHRHAWYAQERRYEMQREADEDQPVYEVTSPESAARNWYRRRGRLMARYRITFEADIHDDADLPLWDWGTLIDLDDEVDHADWSTFVVTNVDTGQVAYQGE